MTLEEKFLQHKLEFKNGFTTTKELNAFQIKNHEISKLCKKGYLIKLRQGVYKVKYPTTTQLVTIGERIIQTIHRAPPINKQKLITQVIPEAVFCFDYAWCLNWGMKRFPKTIHIAVPRSISRSKCKKIKGIDLVIHYLPEDLHSQDVIYGDVPYYNIERTICDLFKYHHFKSERWLSDTTREYVQESLDTDKLNRLIACAEKLYLDKESKDLMERFLWKRAEKRDDMFKFRRKNTKSKSVSKKSSAKKSNKQTATIQKNNSDYSHKKVVKPNGSADYHKAVANNSYFLDWADKETDYKSMERFDELNDPHNLWYLDDEDSY